MGKPSTSTLPAPVAVASRTGEDLALALLGYFFLVTLVITLSPFDFEWRPLRISFEIAPSDMLANIALFLPLGFLLRSLETGPNRRGVPAVAIAALLSLAIETAQIFLRGRFVSPIDIITNTAGAYIGVLARNRVERWTVWNPQTVGNIGLDIPLVGLLYLLVPQLWLSSVGMIEDAWRSVTTLLLSCAGSIVLVALHRHRWRGGTRVAANVIPPLAALWFMVGALPALAGSPTTFGILASFVMLATLLLLRRDAGITERRFEIETLQRFLPIFVVYIIVASLWPPTRALVAWHGALGFLDRLDNTSVVRLLLLLEQVGGFTLLGYALAEWRGRDEISLARDLPRILSVSLAFAALLEGVQGFLAGPGASVARALLATGGAAYGAAVYHLARAHVRTLRTESSRAQPDSARDAA